MSNTDIISKAYDTLSGKWLRVLFPFFIVALIPNLYQPSSNYSPPIYLAFISLFASGPFIYGGSLLALKISRGEDLQRSSDLMKEDKWKLFLLYLLYFLIVIAGLITIIGWLWAFPLIYVSNAIFYEYLKNKQQITKAE